MKTDTSQPTAAGVSRRELLAALALLGTTAALGATAPGAKALLPEGAPGAPAAGGSARRLDFHNHFGSPRWIRRSLERTPRGNQFKGWTPARQIEQMDRGNIQTGFVSCTQPGVWFGDDFSASSPERAQALSLARDMNEYGARMASDYKGRFRLFAVLPLPDIDASLREMEYALDTLHADGVGLLTSYGYLWLGDEALRPLFEELNRRAAIVYVHPTDSSCCHALAHANPSAVEWLSDTGRSINSLVSTAAPYGGASAPPGAAPRVSAATRYANVRFIWSHGGGSLTSVADRVAGFNQTNDVLMHPPAVNSPLWHLRRFYYDTAQSANPILMQALKSLVGSSQIVFGSDCPYVDPATYNQTLPQCGFSAAELRGIDRENALRTLLPKGWMA